MRTVSVIVPVKENAASLAPLLKRLQETAEREQESFEFIFVDDGSRDNSFRILEQLSETDSRVKALRLARNFGPNAACSAGIAYSRGDCVVAVSADLQDPPELIGKMLIDWRLGSKVVLAARSDREDPWLTKLTSNVFWRLFRRYGLSNMPEQGSDYALIDRQVIAALAETNEPNAGIGMILWTGYEPAIIEYKRTARDPSYGRSQWSFSRKLTYFIDLFVSFSNTPIRLVSFVGILMALAGFFFACMIIISVWSGSLNRGETQGWASTIVIILIVSGVQLIMTGVLGEYQVRMLDMVRKRPQFVVDRILDPERTRKRDLDRRRSTRRPRSP